jgi:hypothetical protein
MPDSKQLPSHTIEQLHSALSKNIALHTILESEAIKMVYGQMSVNVVIKDGIADLSTLNIVVNKRNRY